ncbi:MAG: DUF2865 domain-containing protein [Beijerinckiaceae bacterium]
MVEPRNHKRALPRALRARQYAATLKERAVLLPQIASAIAICLKGTSKSFQFGVYPAARCAAKICPSNLEFSSSGFRRRISAALVLAAALLGPAPRAEAQGLDCGRLQAQIAALDQADTRTNPYAAAAQKQRDEINRTRAYAQSIGCNRQQFLFFGNGPPPQCPALNARIQQMQANLAQLEATAGQLGKNAQRQDLVMRYNAYCRGEPQQKGFLESLFGGGNLTPPMDVSPDQALPSEDDQTPKGGSEALCVRSCDGGFFPLTSSARRGAGETLTDLCKALCPNADAYVYSRVPGQAIQTAVSLDGTPYADLPNALKYQKTFDPACTCRPAGQSWAEALAGAERILGHERRGDIIVTPEKSAEMSRPKLDPSQRAKALQAAKQIDAKPNPANAQDDIESRDAASAAQVPTASKDSAGIATGEVKNGTAYPEGQGETVETTGPDGIKRRVRIVGPAL